MKKTGGGSKTASKWGTNVPPVVPSVVAPTPEVAPARATSSAASQAADPPVPASVGDVTMHDLPEVPRGAGRNQDSPEDPREGVPVRQLGPGEWIITDGQGRGSIVQVPPRPPGKGAPRAQMPRDEEGGQLRELPRIVPTDEFLAQRLGLEELSGAIPNFAPAMGALLANRKHTTRVREVLKCIAGYVVNRDGGGRNRKTKRSGDYYAMREARRELEESRRKVSQLTMPVAELSGLIARMSENASSGSGGKRPRRDYEDRSPCPVDHRRPYHE